MEEREGARVAPSDADLERAIASVPGVVSASVGRSGATGRSRLRIRLAAGEDPEKVSWAVAATLRERFSIALDPDDIRPRETSATDPDPSDDPVHLVHPPASSRTAEEEHPAPTEPSSPSEALSPSEAELAATRERLSSSAREALAELRQRFAPADPSREASGEVPDGTSYGERTRVRIVPRSTGGRGIGDEAEAAEAAARVPAAGPTGADDPDSEVAEGAVAEGAVAEDEVAEGEPGAPEPSSDPPRSETAAEAPGTGPRRHTHVGTPWPVDPAMRSWPLRPERTPESTSDTPRSGPREPDEPAEVAPAATPTGDDAPERQVAAPVDDHLRRDPDDPEPGVAEPDSVAPTASEDGAADVPAEDDEPSPSAPAAPPPAASAPAAEDEPSGSPAPLTGRVVAERAAIRHLDTQRDERDVRVTATLEHGGRSATGEVTSVPTSHGLVRAVAEATIAALGGLVGPDLIAGVDRICVQPADDPANALVTVSLVTDRGEETLLGTSVVRGDPEHAVMRATLDALNRRVADLFPSPGSESDDPAA